MSGERLEVVPKPLFFECTDAMSRLRERGTHGVAWRHRGRKEFWGKGYAFEAWTLLLEYTFERLGLRKIIAWAVDGHTGSLTVLKKMGFPVEGVLRGEYLIDGEYYNAIRLGLFREEFYKFAPSPSTAAVARSKARRVARRAAVARAAR